jgi:hypothetical protein
VFTLITGEGDMPLHIAQGQLPLHEQPTLLRIGEWEKEATGFEFEVLQTHEERHCELTLRPEYPAILGS